MASVVQQDFPKSDYEIVVVDNGSTDRTPEIARHFQQIAPVRYVLENRIGLCVARNTGWQSAAGRYISFFDDDAIAGSGWLSAIRDAFERGPRSVGVIGGCVHPIWQGTRPPWLPYEIALSLTIVDWGPSEKIIEDIGREWLVGQYGDPESRSRRDRWISSLARPRRQQPALERRCFLSEGGDATGLSVPLCAIDRDRAPCSPVAPQSEMVHAAILLAGRFGCWQLIEQSPSPVGRIWLALARTRQFMRCRKRTKWLILPTTSPGAFKLKCFALLDIGYILGLLGAARR
jgi:glucosyl-dolichyl phosphate glucuronosyltransferase